MREPRKQPSSLSASSHLTLHVPSAKQVKLSRATKRVDKILRVVPYNMNAAALEALRSLKQELVELDTRAGAIRSMLLDVLDDEEDIRDMLISKVRDDVIAHVRHLKG